eukprot:1501426-Pleurochrysis_carterae.AAC.1
MFTRTLLDAYSDFATRQRHHRQRSLNNAIDVAFISLLNKRNSKFLGICFKNNPKIYYHRSPQQQPICIQYSSHSPQVAIVHLALFPRSMFPYADAVKATRYASGCPHQAKQIASISCTPTRDRAKRNIFVYDWLQLKLGRFSDVDKWADAYTLAGIRLYTRLFICYCSLLGLHPATSHTATCVVRHALPAATPETTACFAKPFCMLKKAKKCQARDNGQAACEWPMPVSLLARAAKQSKYCGMYTRTPMTVYDPTNFASGPWLA